MPLTHYSLFSLTSRLTKESTKNNDRTTDDSTSNADQASSSGAPSPLANTKLHYRHYRLTPPPETKEELLERLLRNAERSGLASEHYLEQMLLFLKRNPDMVNKTPKKFHSNPLELVVQLGDARVAKELLALNATVSETYQTRLNEMIKKIESMFPQFNKKGMKK